MDGYISIAACALLCVLALVAGVGIGAWAVQSVMARDNE